MLATRAARTGAIDYSKTTRDDIFSLMRESYVLRDIKREMTATAVGMFDLVYTSPNNRGFQQQFVKNSLPWVVAANAPDTREEAVVAELVEAWKTLDAHNKKKKAEAQNGHERPDKT